MLNPILFVSGQGYVFAVSKSGFRCPEQGGMGCVLLKSLITTNLDCVGATQLLPGMLPLRTRAFGIVGAFVGLGKNAASLRYPPKPDASYTFLQLGRLMPQRVVVFFWFK